MNRYGQAITWSTIGAPHIFSGSCTGYSLRDALTRQLISDEAGDNMALVLHSAKAELNFSAKVTAASTDFLDLSAGAAITVSGISAGIVLARRAVETWALSQPKTASVEATWFPDMTQASPAMAGITANAFSPSQSALTIVTPGSQIIYGTYPMTHAAGVVHGLTITQELQITEDEPSPDGKILGAASHGYLRTLELLLLVVGGVAAPAKGSTLSITGAPSNAANFKVENVETRYTELRGEMYQVNGIWIPPIG